ncbi:MAG: RagB/SusD family nutrient uptake outer membrane protein [Tannerella sp.]|jgi:hypothetical protein|nr:RagB/SusD family nutrient uptake outer membrane protein [Tannerella sp.]
MKNKINIALSTFVFLLITSCSGFLDETPRHLWSVNEALTTRDKALHAVNGIYYRLCPGDNLNGALNLSYTSKSGIISFSAVEFDMTYTQTASGVIAAPTWSSLFSVINAANLAINGIPDIPESAFPDPKEKTQLIAEAKILRAWMNAIQLWNYAYWHAQDDSPYGIIYRPEVTNAQNASMPRVTVGESYEYIFNDLDEGIAAMPAFNTNKKVSALFGKALKAKILLNRGVVRNSTDDLQKALSLVNELLNTDIPATPLKMEADMKETFAKSWDSNEHIFVRYLEDNANRTSNGGYWTTYGLAYNAYTNLNPQTGLPLTDPPPCGLRYGTDWIIPDPRYQIATGLARKPETWDDTYCYTWTKIYRKGSIAGKQDPVDEKYATYYLRLPELYIMQAELLARTGATTAQAIAPINVMRSKRTFPLLPPLSVPASQDELYEIIFREYVKELLLENGAEFFASVRFQKDGHPYMEIIKGGSFVMEYERLQWPIPNAELLVNSLIEQNPLQK